MVTRESVHQEVFRRYQRAQERLRPLTEDPEYKERAYAQIEGIIKAWGFEENAKREADNRVWRLLDEEAAMPKFKEEHEIDHLFGPIYATLWTHGGMYDFEIAHAIRKPVFAVNHGLRALAQQAEGCPMTALGSKCPKIADKLVGTRSTNTEEFREYSEPIMRYANSKARGTGVAFQPRKADGGKAESVFVLEDKSEVALDTKAKKFSYNGKAVEPPAVNDLFRKSWYEWRAKHGRKRR